MPLLDEEAHEKAETPEKDAIEMKEKASTTSEGEKDDSASSTSSSSTSARSWWLSCKRPSSPWPALSALASTRGPAARRQRSSPFKTIKMEHSTSAIDSFYHAKPDTRRHADHKLFS